MIALDRAHAVDSTQKSVGEPFGLDIDATALDSLYDDVAELRRRGIALAFVRLRSEVADQIERAYPIEDLADATYLEVDDGVEAFTNGAFGRRRSPARFTRSG